MKTEIHPSIFLARQSTLDDALIDSRWGSAVECVGARWHHHDLSSSIRHGNEPFITRFECLLTSPINIC